MSVHAPRPWRAERYIGPRLECIIDARGREIAMMQDHGKDADARLIAAAPDLLAALVGLVEVAGEAMKLAGSEGYDFDVDRELMAARAAIAKAMGES